jgi:hypothetical protein
MADRTIKPDDTNDLVLQNNHGGAKIEINENDTLVFTPSLDVVPSNLVAYRASGESTPSGWSEYTSARGRMIVGLPSGGTDGGTVGTALTNVQDKTFSNSHTHTGPSHSHQIQLVNWGTGNVQMSTTSTHYGTSGTFTSNKYIEYNSTTTYGLGIPLTNSSGTGNTGSGGADIDTSDLLAYVQLMAIKKD